MKTISLIYISLVIFSYAGFAQAEWKIIGPDENVVSGKSYYLQVALNDLHLTYKKRRDPGINLGWNKESEPNFKFLIEGGGQIKSGDKVAIYVGNMTGPEKYLLYKVRDNGINLSWSSTPVYEWELRDLDNKKGNPIKTNSNIGIVNNIEKGGQGDFLVYCHRKYSRTVNLAWFNDCSGGYRLPGKLNDGQIKELVVKAIKYRSALHPALALIPVD